jgi:hypothetical protein
LLAIFISVQHGFQKVAVISGVGVRRYYERLGFSLQGEGQFMIKTISPPNTGGPNFKPNNDALATKWTRQRQVDSQLWCEWDCGDDRKIVVGDVKQKRFAKQQHAAQQKAWLIKMLVFVVVLIAVACFYLLPNSSNSIKEL